MNKMTDKSPIEATQQAETTLHSAQVTTMLSATQSASPGESLQNMIGLAALVYSDGGLIHNGTLPKVNDTIRVNGAQYRVIDIEDDASGYQGMTLFDAASKSIIVVNRGTQKVNDIGTDADMALETSSNQWQGAKALGSRVAALATQLGATSIYATGHSLGGTLTQMQCAYFGWQGYTFNAYGADEVYNKLNLTVNPGAHIVNYRTMFDLVSDASTHIGDSPITIETPQDLALLDSFYEHSPSLALDFLTTIAEDHGIGNFHGGGDPIGDLLGTGDNVFTLAPGFHTTPPSAQTLAIAEDIVSSLGELIHFQLEAIPGVGPFQSGDLSLQQIAQEVMQFIDHEPVSGIKAVVPADPSLLADALNPAAVNDAARASLAALSPVLLQGLDPGSFVGANLWAPGQTTGLTKAYLIARNAMIQAKVAMAGAGQAAGGSLNTNNADTYVYSDLSRSPDPLYTLKGNGGDTYDVIFADDKGDVLQVSPNSHAELFGGAGDDILMDSSTSTLQGGAGDDEYFVDGTRAGTDDILDTDGNGAIDWTFADGSTKTLTGGNAVAGTSLWKSSDGSVTYTEGSATDGSTALKIISGDKTVYIDDFTNGELGITLNDGNTTTPGAANLGNFTKTTYTDHTEYQDLSGTAGGDSMDGVNTTGGNANILEGEGNASYIYAGDGNNDAFANDMRYSPVGEVFSYPANVMIQGGSGDQLLVGMGDDGSQGNAKETIIGGDMGQDTAAFDTIDGGGTFVDALLAGGSQNSLIFGGLGTDTILAGSATAGSNKPDPTTIAMAGLSFWASASQTAQGGGSVSVTGEPNVSFPGFADPADFQIDLALNQLDGSYAAPFGLLGSQWDSGTATSPWKDANGTPIALPGSLMIGGSGEDFLIGNSGNDTLIGGTPAHPKTGVIDEVLVGGGGADVIYGGGGTELIFADLSAAGDADWANLDPTDADTIYGGSGNEYIYGSGGNDVIDGGSGNYTIYTGNGDAYVETGSGNTIVNGGTGNDMIIAGSGADSITTGDGNSYVEVQGGQSTITTGAGSDTIEAAGGDALITEGRGTTTIIAGTSTGSDTVQLGSGSTVMQLQSGLSESALVARDINGDLVLSDPGFDTRITFSDYFKDGGNVSLQFQGGTTWGTSQILAASMAPRTDGGNDTLVGSNGNDSITAGYGDTSIVGVSGNNTLTGGAGDDTIQGGSSADTIEGGSGTTQIVGGTGLETYVFNVGDGSDTITENTSVAGTDALKFGAGIAQSDVTFSKDSSGDLLITFRTVSASTIEVPDFFASESPQHQIGTFQFADGTSLTRQQIIQPLVAIDGTTGNDYLYGTSGIDYFDGKGGNDQENGDGGSDTFVFNSGYGNLEINESYASGEKPVLQLGAGITASALQVASLDSNSLYLSDGVSGDQIILENEETSPGSSGVAEVQFADGSTLSAAQLIQMSHKISGTSGNDTLWGTTGADHFDGMGGGDEEIGVGGDDTFVFNPGYGSLEIQEIYQTGQQSVLQLGDGITPSALHVSEIDQGYYSGPNVGIELTDGITGDEVTIESMISYANYGLQELRFADGTTLTRDQLLRMATTGTQGNDTLYGSPGADYFDGKGADSQGGDDEETGNGGSDTFVFNAGYGKLWIDETYSSGQQPVLQLGAGIMQSSLHAAIDDSGSLVLTDGVTGDEVTLTGILDGENSSVSEVRLFDGTTLTRNQLINMETSSGTSGNDTLRGASEADYFDGKGGNDSETGGGGTDTFVFNPGYGSLVISEECATGEQPVLQLGAGITSSSLRVSGDGENIILSDGIVGDQVTLESELADGPNTAYQDGVQEVEFADGTTLSKAQLIQMETTGTSGDDTLYGTPGSDYFDGKGGNDIEYATGNFLGGGSDTFVFNPGYGHLEIVESYSTPVPQQPIIQLGAGITLSDLRVNSDGRNLEVTDGTSGDQIKIDDGLWDTPATPGLPEVKLSDGTSLSMEQLVQMETSAGGTPGNDSLYGTSGDELFDGKGGNDYEEGNGGSDTFVFNPGYGNLLIDAPNSINLINGTTPNPGILELGSGISPATTKVTENDQRDLIITDGVSGDEITLQPISIGYPTAWGVNAKFSDGTTWNRDQILQLASNLNGTAGSDYLVGTAGAEVLDGHGGNDYELGNGGDDTFVFNKGYGALEIGQAFGYTLQLGPGFTPSNLEAFESHSGGGWDVILTDGTSDVIRLDGMYEEDGGGNVVQFSDGSTLALSQLIDDINIYYPGVETYRVGAGTGNQSIEYSSYASHIDIDYVDGITSADVTVRGDPAGDLTLTNKSTGSQFFLRNYFNGSPNVFVNFADGVTWEGAQILQAMQTGGPGNDTLSGTLGAEFFDGKGGDDSIIGGGGNDTFTFNPGYGDLEIDENFFHGGQPVLQLGSGITASALRVTANGDNLVLTDGVNGDQVTLDWMWSSATSGVTTVQLADGTAFTRSQLLQMVSSSNLAGTSGDDLLAGSPGADLLDGKVSNDIAVDGGENDAISKKLRAPDDLISPRPGAAAGAGNIRLSVAPPSVISSPGGRVGKDLQQGHSVSHADAHAGLSPIADTQSTFGPGAVGGRQSPVASNVDQHGIAPPRIPVFDTHSRQTLSLTQAQRESDADPSPGAPVDPLLSDPDDVRAGLGYSSGDVAGDGMQRSLAIAASNGVFESAFGPRQIARTAYAADDMVKALTAQNGLLAHGGHDFGAESPDQIRLQDGATWALSTVDRTLAALAPAASGADDASTRLIDLAHAQLISAMGSFSPTVPAESSSLLSPSSDAYAIAIAAPAQ